jgi:hypothetical protein
VYVAAAQQLQELVLSEAGLGNSDMQQLGEGLETAAAAAASATAAAPLLAGHSSSSSGSGSRPGHSGIRVLDLRGNSSGPAGAMQLGRGLGGGCSSLNTLQLGSNRLGAEGVSRFFEGLLAAATTSTCGQGEDGAAAAAGSGCMRLQELDLSGNNISGRSLLGRVCGLGPRLAGGAGAGSRTQITAVGIGYLVTDVHSQYKHWLQGRVGS